MESTKSSQKRKNKDKTAMKTKKNHEAIQLLRSWRKADEAQRQEQQETWKFLKNALDEDREAVSARKLFS